MMPNQQSVSAQQLMDAITAETRAYQDHIDHGGSSTDQVVNDATDAAIEAESALLALSMTMTCDPEYILALALAERRLLVMNGDYTDPQMVGRSRLIHAVLAGTRFDDVPMLWHIEGEPHSQRPTDEQFRKAMEAFK